MTRIRSLALAVLAILPLAAAADFRYCEIAADIRVDNRQVLAPNAIVEFGKEAEFTEEDVAGNHGWQLKIVLDEPTIVRRVTGIPADIRLYELVEGAPVLRVSPRAVIAPGQPVELQVPFGEGDPRKATLHIVAQPRSEADVPPPSDDNG